MEYKWFKDYIAQIKKSDIEAAKSILINNIPEKTMIYKYCRGLNRDISNLFEQKLWLSNVFGFNDPYDSAIIVDCGFKLQYPKEQRKQAMEDYFRQQEADKNAKELQSCLFVACFSEVNDSFPMWGYYAADHKGLCIGYDLRELVSKYDCMPVIYTSELVTYKENDSDINILLSALTKSDEWKHEREWRIIKQSDEHKGQKGILLEKFAKPIELFIGCRQKETISLNCEMEKRNVHWNELYADIEEIMSYAEEHYVDLYYPIISRIKYKLIDRGIKLIR